MNKMTELAKEYRIPTQATPEDLETRWGKVITFGDRVIFVGHYYHPDGNCYFAAVYEFLDDDHTCDVAQYFILDNSKILGLRVGNS